MVVLLVFGLTEAVAPGPAHADPSNPDGTYSSLQTQLDAASRAYNDAKGRLDAAQQRQVELTAQAADTKTKLADLTVQANALVAAAYKGGRLTGLATLLDSSSADDFLDRASMLQDQLTREDRTLHELNDTQARYVEQVAAIDNEVRTQQAAVAAMEQKRKDIEKALANAGSGGAASGPGGGTANASPAPRNPDGSWPRESCSINDPTGTGGCVTPRMLHAYQEARKAGFTRYTKCWRRQSWGEHPLGRACDFSADASGFLNQAASGDDKAYGNRLAAWFLANSNRLAVLYVIWYRQIWLPATGWRAYHGDGTPAGDHLNHVHLSVQ
jgi:hypothetical protein